MRRISAFVTSAAFLAALAACSGASTPTDPVAQAAPAPAQDMPNAAPLEATAGTATADAIQGPPAPASDAPAFAGKTWKVAESDAVQVGMTYAFNADGTLVIRRDAADPPGNGKWIYTDGKLTIEEEGVAYPTDIERLDAGHFDIRSHNPGGSISIRMVPAG